jgi:predicted enzyme related to lactoylglutathione lyase
VLPQHLDCHPRHRAPKFAKSEGAIAEPPKDHRLPATLNHLDGRVNGTLVSFDMACALFAHAQHPKRTGYFKVPTCERVLTNIHCCSHMASARLFRVIVPVSSIEDATVFYSAVLEQPGIRVSPGRHYFGCGSAILACFDPRADGDGWDARPNPEYLYFAVDDLDEYYRRVSGQPNGSILRPIETQPWGERSFYCTDLFGNKLCFVDERTIFTGGLI